MEDTLQVDIAYDHFEEVNEEDAVHCVHRMAKNWHD
jgi:hypothetical protein